MLDGGLLHGLVCSRLPETKNLKLLVLLLGRNMNLGGLSVSAPTVVHLGRELHRLNVLGMVELRQLLLLRLQERIEGVGIARVIHGARLVVGVSCLLEGWGQHGEGSALHGLA